LREQEMLAMADYILVVRILPFFTNFLLLASDPS
jgi:hypothetical protein